MRALLVCSDARLGDGDGLPLPRLTACGSGASANAIPHRSTPTPPWLPWTGATPVASCRFRAGRGSHLRLLRIVIPFSPGGASTDNDGTTIPTSPQMPINRTQGFPAMAQTLHPLEAWILQRRIVRKLALSAFLEDGHLSNRERIALDTIAAEDEAIVESRARRPAAQSFERNGDTRLTRDRFRDAGHQLIDLATERTKRAHNVTPIRQDVRA